MKSFQYIVAALLLVSSAVTLADRPDPEVPNPPLQVQEFNVDGDGYIAVHEQGTAKVEVQGAANVNVTGGSIDANVTGGEVEVTNTVNVSGSVGADNFPGQQSVWVDGGMLTPVDKANFDRWTVNPKTGAGRY